MSLFASFDTHRFDLEVSEHGPQWLELRNELSWRERQHLNSSMLDIDVRSDGESTMKADVGKYQPAILEAYVAGWQAFDNDGRLIPFDKELLGRLKSEVCEAVLEHISGREQVQEKIKKVIPIKHDVISILQ